MGVGCGSVWLQALQTINIFFLICAMLNMLILYYYFLMNQYVLPTRLWTLALRLLLTYTIYSSFFYDPGLSTQICGPLAIPLKPPFFTLLMWIQLIRLSVPLLMRVVFRHPPRALTCYSLKYGVLFVVQLILLYQSHRFLYYVHTLVIQVVLLILCGLIDITSNANLGEVGEIIVLEPIHRIALVYQVSRTFCPNFGLYWFFTTLLELVGSQMEAHMVKDTSKKVEVTYLTSLYVKQDVYRIMMFTSLFWGVFAAAQLTVYGAGMLCLFAAVCGPLFWAASSFNQGRVTESMLLLCLVCVCVPVYVYSRIYYPEYYKQLGLEQTVCPVYFPLLSASTEAI